MTVAKWIVTLSITLFVMSLDAYDANILERKQLNKRLERLKYLPSGSRKMKGDLPPEYETVYPYMSDKYGNYVGKICQMKAVRRWSNSKLSYTCKNKFHNDRMFVMIETKREKLLLNLRRNKKIILNHPSVEFVDEFGKIKHQAVYEPCHYIGNVKRQKSSLAALSNCDGLSGLIRTTKADYLIEPLKIKKINSSIHFPHIVYRVETGLTWRNISVEGDFLINKGKSRKNRDLGHDFDIKQLFPFGKLPAITPSMKLYLETLVAADHTVVNFHGHRHVAQYIMTLMNIVSTIYDDPGLNANIAVVVVKIMLVDKAKHNVSIIKKNTRASLDNVCQWANSLFKENQSAKYDIVIFLTKLDIGGAAGYAPLSSICDSNKSCTMNKDEGLTSAFILAHEIAHVLGLSHDGDEIEGNNCSGDGLQGSIMAPTVQSNFNRYFWSNCSIAQFHEKRELWFCMVNKPNSSSIVQTSNLPDIPSYTLDEQCRQEFGANYTHCKMLTKSKPCLNLWCTTNEKPPTCKTKNGPPLDGTPCGEGKWCVKGHCERQNKRHVKNPIHRNPQHGGWSKWSAYGPCSRSCGTGVKFKTRRCDNPEPEFGGNNCVGPSEKFQLCETQPCEEFRDFRVQQCKNIGKTIHLDATLQKFKWVAHPLNNTFNPCRLVCLSKHTSVVLNTGENVVDGTLCKYDGSKNICVQGECQLVGCDGLLNSRSKPNQCGICKGDTTMCKNVEKNYYRIPSQRFTRVAVLPIRARQITIRKTKGAPYFLVLQSRKHRQFILNEGKSRQKSHQFIALGSQFNYVNENGIELLTTPGPLFYELTVLISVFRGKTLAQVSVNYTIPINKSLDSVIGVDYNEWKIVGWTKCSHVCGGGIQELRTVCVDKRSGKSISKRHCSLLDKPPTRKRTCNTNACQYRWKAEPWEYCSQTCGTKGIQEREVNCIIVNATNVNVKSYLCTEEKPLEVQPCNILPCPASWEVGPWSACSVTCGTGVHYRNVTCSPPENDVIYECEDIKPLVTGSCQEPPCPDVCVKDNLKACEKQELLRYCNLEGIYKNCCKSCNEYLNGLKESNALMAVTN